MKKLLIIGLCVTIAATLGACNTVQGMGRDIQSAGEAIQKM